MFQVNIWGAAFRSLVRAFGVLFNKSEYNSIILPALRWGDLLKDLDDLWLLAGRIVARIRVSTTELLTNFKTAAEERRIAFATAF